MKAWGMLLVLVCLNGYAGEYPVDAEIADLRAKADHLELLKNLLENNRCTVTSGKTSVVLSPDTIRSQGVVIGVGDGFPGNYLAYHKAPKPQHLAGVVNMTLLSNTAGQTAKVVSVWFYGEADVASHLLVSLNEPYPVKGTSNLWQYSKTSIKLKITDDKVIGKRELKSAMGTIFSLDCH